MVKKKGLWSGIILFIYALILEIFILYTMVPYLLESFEFVSLIGFIIMILNPAPYIIAGIISRK